MPWTARRSNQSILKEINPEYSLEGLKLKGAAEDEMVGWHHQLNGHEFDQTPGDGVGKGSLVSCSPWGRKESDTTERLNNNNPSPYSPPTIHLVSL